MRFGIHGPMLVHDGHALIDARARASGRCWQHSSCRRAGPPGGERGCGQTWWSRARFKITAGKELPGGAMGIRTPDLLHAMSGLLVAYRR